MAGPAAHARRLLVSSKSASTTYIALAVIVAVLVLLAVIGWVIVSRCGRTHAGGEMSGKDVELTGVLSSGVSQRGQSFSSTGTSPRTMARACDRDVHSSSGSLQSSWRDKPLDMRPSSMSRRQPLRGIGRRPGGLPTIPSVTSMGSATRSEASDVGTSLFGSQNNLHTESALVTDRSLDPNDSEMRGSDGTGNASGPGTPLGAWQGRAGRPPRNRSVEPEFRSASSQDRSASEN